MGQLVVSDLMTKDVVTIEQDESLEVAEQMMKAARIHHLPVVDKRGELVGVITAADLSRASVSVLAEPTPDEESELKQHVPVGMVMSTRITTVTPSSSALRAAEILKRSKFGCLPVLEDGRLLGILTEGDFMNLVIRALREDVARVSVPPKTSGPLGQRPRALS